MPSTSSTYVRARPLPCGDVLARHVVRLEIDRRDAVRIAADVAPQIVGHEHPVKRRVEADEDGSRPTQTFSVHSAKRRIASARLQAVAQQMLASQAVDLFRVVVPLEVGIGLSST